jgi:hypothetical protein
MDYGTGVRMAGALHCNGNGNGVMAGWRFNFMIARLSSFYSVLSVTQGMAGTVLLCITLLIKIVTSGRHNYKNKDHPKAYQIVRHLKCSKCISILMQLHTRKPKSQ